MRILVRPTLPGDLVNLGMLAITFILSTLLSLTTASCPAPPVIEHSSHDAGGGNSFPTDTIVEYTCEDGYRTSGNGMTICQADGTWSEMPSYTCNPVSCGDPGYVQNGYRDSEVFTFGAELIYECNPGYEIVGAAWLQCLSDGTWNYPLPSCLGVQCPEPSRVSGGDFFPNVGPFRYKLKITITCHDNNQRPNPEERICQANRTWTGTDAVCEDLTCHKSYQQLMDGNVGGPETITIGSVLHFSCHDNATLDGASYAVCQDPGVWSTDKPVCWRSCSVPEIANGSATLPEDGSAMSGTPFLRHDRRIMYVCSVGFGLHGNNSAVCFNGTFDSKVPTCVHVEHAVTTTPTTVTTVKKDHWSTSKKGTYPPTRVRTTGVPTEPPETGPNHVLITILSFLGGLVLVLILGLLAWLTCRKCKKDDRGEFKKYCSLKYCCSCCPCVKRRSRISQVALTMQESGKSTN